MKPYVICHMMSSFGYSRRFHFWCAAHADAEHTYEGVIRSLDYLGGVPHEVLVDNQKAAVLQHLPNGVVTFNPRFVDLAAHYGFTPRACRPYRAQTKGKDERMVGYIKQHFFVRYRAFDSWTHVNQRAEQWLREEADQRFHGTVKELVAERFERERPALAPLPAQRYDTAYYEHRQVSWDGYVEVRGNRYSVPAALVGQTIAVRIGVDDTLRVVHGRTKMLPKTEQSYTSIEHSDPVRPGTLDFFNTLLFWRMPVAYPVSTVGLTGYSLSICSIYTGNNHRNNILHMSWCLSFPPA